MKPILNILVDSFKRVQSEFYWQKYTIFDCYISFQRYLLTSILELNCYWYIGPKLVQSYHKKFPLQINFEKMFFFNLATADPIIINNYRSFFWPGLHEIKSSFENYKSTYCSVIYQNCVFLQKIRLSEDLKHLFLLKKIKFLKS
jgi:hypothetical protein